MQLKDMVACLQLGAYQKVYRPHGRRFGYYQNHTVTDEDWKLFYAERKSKNKWVKKFAYLPRLLQGQIVWLGDYYEKQKHYYINGKLDTLYIECYTKEYYIGKKLMGEL